MIERIVVGFLSTNTYIFSEWKKECIIIDPGGDAELIKSHMKSKNLTPRGIVCTHGHWDHTGALGQLKAHFMDQDIALPIAAHGADGKYFGNESKQEHKKSFENLELGDDLFDELFSTIPEIDILLEEEDRLFESGLVVIHTPGHTPGGISLYHESMNILFSGDILFLEGIGRTDLTGGNEQELKKSISEKIFTLPSETRVYPGHGPFTSVEREREYNPYVR